MLSLHTVIVLCFILLLNDTTFKFQYISSIFESYIIYLLYLKRDWDTIDLINTHNVVNNKIQFWPFVVVDGCSSPIISGLLLKESKTRGSAVINNKQSCDHCRVLFVAFSVDERRKNSYIIYYYCKNTNLHVASQFETKFRFIF